jgi:hypothetical protein
MKKKIIGILVCTLLIAIAIPMVSGNNQKQQLNFPYVIDAQQNNTNQIHWLPGGVPNWQTFYNQGEKLLKVELHFGYYGGTSDVTFSILENLSSAPLTVVTYQASSFPPDVQTWFTFDVPDVELDQGRWYTMVIFFEPGSEYGWSGDFGNPYPLGVSSHTSSDWDYAFKTIVNKPKPKIISTSILQMFFERFPNMFPLLRQMLKM